MDCQNCMKYFNCPLVRSVWTKGRVWCYVPDSGTEEDDGGCLGFDDNYWENKREKNV